MAFLIGVEEDAFLDRFVGFGGVPGEAGDDCGVIGRDVVGFADVLAQVVQFPVVVRFASIDLPVALANGCLRAMFPVKVIVLLLF